MTQNDQTNIPDTDVIIDARSGGARQALFNVLHGSSHEDVVVTDRGVAG